jgi:hypothetical protein
VHAAQPTLHAAGTNVACVEGHWSSPLPAAVNRMAVATDRKAITSQLCITLFYWSLCPLCDAGGSDGGRVGVSEERRGPSSVDPQTYMTQLAGSGGCVMCSCPACWIGAIWSAMMSDLGERGRLLVQARGGSHYAPFYCNQSTGTTARTCTMQRHLEAGEVSKRWEARKLRGAQ